MGSCPVFPTPYTVYVVIGGAINTPNMAKKEGDSICVSEVASSPNVTVNHEFLVMINSVVIDTNTYCILNFQPTVDWYRTVEQLLDRFVIGESKQPTKDPTALFTTYL